MIAGTESLYNSWSTRVHRERPWDFLFDIVSYQILATGLLLNLQNFRTS